MNKQSEQMRRLRLESERDPVENAVLAFCALSDVGKSQMIERYNAIQRRKSRPNRLEFTASETGSAQ